MPDLKPTKVLMTFIGGAEKMNWGNCQNQKVPKLKIKARKGTLEEE